MASTTARITETSWGNTRDGAAVSLFTLISEQLTVTLTNFGARIVSVLVPGEHGAVNVSLGYNSLAEYEADDKNCLGAVVGRYANRLALGRFELDGKTYQVPINNGANVLHGGPEGFDRKVWQASVTPHGVEFRLTSPDGEMGFPGTLQVSVVYSLHGGDLRIEYSATTDAPTVVNLTNHAYFNLAGESSGNILEQQLFLAASHYTPVTPELIPTGVLAPVAGTPFGFRKLTAIGARIAADDEQLHIARGYDHNFILDHTLDGSGLREAARVVDPASGRSLTVLTTEPGVQFYSGNFLDGSFTGAGGKPYAQRSGFCLETQHYPDSPNQPQFPSTVLRPGETLRSTTIFRFASKR